MEGRRPGGRWKKRRSGPPALQLGAILRLSLQKMEGGRPRPPSYHTILFTMPEYGHSSGLTTNPFLTGFIRTYESFSAYCAGVLIWVGPAITMNEKDISLLELFRKIVMVAGGTIEFESDTIKIQVKKVQPPVTHVQKGSEADPF